MKGKEGNISYLLKVAYEKDKSIFLLVIINAIVVGLKPLLFLLYPKVIIDGYQASWVMGKVVTYVSIVSLGLILASYIENYLYAVIRARFIILRQEFVYRYSNRCMNMKYQYTEDKDVLNQSKIALTAIHSNLSGVEAIYTRLSSVLKNIITLIAYSLVLSTLNPLIILVLTIGVAAQNYFVYKAKKYEHSREEEKYENLRKTDYFEGTMSDFAYGKEIRLNNLEGKLVEKYEEAREEEVKLVAEVEGKYAFYHILNSLINLFTHGFAILFIIMRSLNGLLSISNFIVYFQSIADFSLKVALVADDIIDIKKQSLLVTKLRQFLELESETSREEEDLELSHAGDIEFRGVEFAYPNAEKNTINNLDVYIKQGEKIGIVGPNGAGKTTFVKLLMKLYEPTKGEILYKDKNINHIPVKKYQGIFSTIFQECLLLAFTIRENIGLGNNKRFEEAVALSGIGEKVEKLPHGLETPLTKYFEEHGVELSGGEKQKLMMARAINKDGGIYVFDEPTAALDPIAEGEIYENFAKIVKGKTALFISHRLSSTRFCDRIIYIDNGSIKESGTHEELMALDGDYAHMYSVQSKYYKEGGIDE